MKRGQIGSTEPEIYVSVFLRWRAVPECDRSLPMRGRRVVFGHVNQIQHLLDLVPRRIDRIRPISSVWFQAEPRPSPRIGCNRVLEKIAARMIYRPMLKVPQSIWTAGEPISTPAAERLPTRAFFHGARRLVAAFGCNECLRDSNSLCLARVDTISESRILIVHSTNAPNGAYPGCPGACIAMYMNALIDVTARAGAAGQD